MYDSIDRYKTEYVEKQLTSMQNFWIVLGKILAAAVILIGVAIIIKRKLKG
jgi:prolipoprotein diacylglyceryltransferase